MEGALKWSNFGGLVEFCWHWQSPLNPNGQDSFYSAQSNFDLPGALSNPNSDGYRAIIADIDVVITQLRRFQQAGHVVLFRPLVCC